jgi:NAD(P)-dependent dehydrogenase (short-subunit alcohol dehydrogenase family)
MQIAGHTFLVSGGSSGLGMACVRMLAAAGGNVVIADVNDDAGNKLAAELGPRVRFAHTEVTDENRVRTALGLACQAFGELQGVIQCAGIVLAERVLGKTGTHPLEHFVRVIQINLVGTFNVLRLSAEIMSANKPGPGGERGVIVNTGSVAAFDGQIGQAAYSASKAGLVGMTLPVARELARYGIRVMTIAPGIFETPMLSGMPVEVQESLGKMVPFPPRLGRPAEYASLVAEIIRNPMLNGEVIRLDGAIRMQPK